MIIIISDLPRGWEPGRTRTGRDDAACLRPFVQRSRIRVYIAAPRFSRSEVMASVCFRARWMWVWVEAAPCWRLDRYGAGIDKPVHAILSFIIFYMCIFSIASDCFDWVLGTFWIWGFRSIFGGDLVWPGGNPGMGNCKAGIHTYCKRESPPPPSPTNSVCFCSCVSFHVSLFYAFTMSFSDSHSFRNRPSRNEAMFQGESRPCIGYREGSSSLLQHKAFP